MNPERMFPVLGGPLIVPWALIEPHEQQARRNHGQRLKELAKRGGLAWSEMLAVLEDRPWSSMPDAEARAAVLAIVKPPAIKLAWLEGWLACRDAAAERAAKWAAHSDECGRCENRCQKCIADAVSDVILGMEPPT